MPEIGTLFAIAGGLIGFIVIIILLSSTFYMIEQQTKGVIQRFGKFQRIAEPGLGIKIPFIDQIVDRVNLRVRQLDVDIETKTLDDVFVKVQVSVQYQVMVDKVHEAYYRLQNHREQMQAYIFDVVRAQVPRINLNAVFTTKEEIAGEIKRELSGLMDDFGYTILQSLVTDIDPDANVKLAMNKKQANVRLREAAADEGEAAKILKIKEAEAEAESKELQGIGIAKQRAAIVKGLRESVDEFQAAIDDVTAKEVMNLVLMTQYFDTLHAVASASNTNTILMPHSPGGMTDTAEQIRRGFIEGHAVSEAASNGTNGHSGRATPAKTNAG